MYLATTSSDVLPLLTMRLKSRCGCQNHPLAKTAISLEGLAGAVGISGQMLSMLEANRGIRFRCLFTTGTNEFTDKIAFVKMEARMSGVFGAMIFVLQDGVVRLAVLCLDDLATVL